MNNQDEEQVVDSKTLFWNRVQLLLILAVFAAPILGAMWFMKYGNKDSLSYGEIYQPVRTVRSLTLNAGDGEVSDFDGFRRQWVMLVLAKQQCNEACEFNLLKIRQLKQMQNNNMKRIRTVFLHTDMAVEKSDDLVKKYSGIEGYSVDMQAFDIWTETLKRENGTVEDEHNRLYIIDPAGNLMMSYPAEADPNYMKKDIKKLLKASQIG